MALILGLHCDGALAATNHFELSPEQLFDATVISASRSSQKLMDAPAAIYVLSHDDLMRSGATSIPEALRMVPGVQVARVNTSGWAISVRGFNGGLANKLLVLIDGREVYDPLFSGVYWDVQDTMLEDIERIEVIRGPGATLWGANAVNGVINIITRSARDTQGGLVSALAGNQERAIVSGRYGVKAGDAYVRMYGKYLNRDEEQLLNRADAHDEWTASRGGFHADWKNAGEDSFTLQGDAYRSDANQLRFMPFFTAPFNRLRKEEILATGGNILGRWAHELNDKSQLTTQAYVDFAARDQLLVQDRRVSFDIDTQYELAGQGRHQWIVGAHYRASKDDLTGTHVVTFQKHRDHDMMASGFFQDKITLVPSEWFLTLGSKLEYNDYSGIEVQPNARLQFHPDDAQMVWASVARAVRTPSRFEQDLNIVQTAVAGPISLDTVANPDFDSEELVAYELGYRRQWNSGVSLDVATFYNDYDQLSALSLQGLFLPPPRFILAYAPDNLVTAETYGMETSVNWRVMETLKLAASYSLLDIEMHVPVTSSTLGAEGAEGQSPNHQFNLRSMWNFYPDMTLDTALYYVSELPGYDVEGYWRFDVQWGWEISEGLHFSLVGQNLLHGAQREFTSPTDTHVFATEINPSLYGKFTWRF